MPVSKRGQGGLKPSALGLGVPGSGDDGGMSPIPPPRSAAPARPMPTAPRTARSARQQAPPNFDGGAGGWQEEHLHADYDPGFSRSRSPSAAALPVRPTGDAIKPKSASLRGNVPQSMAAQQQQQQQYQQPRQPYATPYVEDEAADYDDEGDEDDEEGYVDQRPVPPASMRAPPGVVRPPPAAAPAAPGMPPGMAVPHGEAIQPQAPAPPQQQGQQQQQPPRRTAYTGEKGEDLDEDEDEDEDENQEDEEDEHDGVEEMQNQGQYDQMAGAYADPGMGMGPGMGMPMPGPQPRCSLSCWWHNYRTLGRYQSMNWAMKVLFLWMVINFVMHAILALLYTLCFQNEIYRDADGAVSEKDVVAGLMAGIILPGVMCILLIWEAYLLTTAKPFTKSILITSAASGLIMLIFSLAGPPKVVMGQLKGDPNLDTGTLHVAGGWSFVALVFTVLSIPLALAASRSWNRFMATYGLPEAFIQRHSCRGYRDMQAAYEEYGGQYGMEQQQQQYPPGEVPAYQQYQGQYPPGYQQQQA